MLTDLDFADNIALISDGLIQADRYWCVQIGDGRCKGLITSGSKEIESTRCVSFDIMFTTQSFENACWHREACRDIDNTRWVLFDIKFARQGFEKACWHREACRAIQHAFSKPSLVNLMSNDANLVFYLSVYLLFSLFKLAIMAYRLRAKKGPAPPP